MKKPTNKTRQRLIFVICMLTLFGIMAFVSAQTSTPQFLTVDGDLLPHSIAEERMIELGGVDQYVLLRGKNRNAPLLIYVHGGPGATSTPFHRIYNGDLEQTFLTVYWDQRGATKSFDPNLDTADFTIDRFTTDLAELVDLVLTEFDQEQILLVGHSWGTVIALEYAARHPEKVAAYVAVSQTTNQEESDRLGYEWALAEAKATDQQNVVEQLEAIGAPPYELEEFFTQRRFVNFLGGGLVEETSDFELLRTALSADEYAWPDAISFLRGAPFSSEALWAEQAQYNAFEHHPSIDVPYYLIFGAQDKVIPTELGVDYFGQLDAPHKELILFENSAHTPFFEEPAKFNQTIIKIAQEVALISD